VIAAVIDITHAVPGRPVTDTGASYAHLPDVDGVRPASPRVVAFAAARSSRPTERLIHRRDARATVGQPDGTHISTSQLTSARYRRARGRPESSRP